MLDIPTLPDSPLLLEQQNNVFLIDWLTVVFHHVSVPYVQALLGMPADKFPWETERVFRNGYPMQTKCQHITIRWGADDAQYYTSDAEKSAEQKVRTDMGICLDISGQGCREFENVDGNDWLKFLKEICDRDTKINITRMDLAYDDHTGLLDIYRIANDVTDRNYTGRVRRTRVLWSDDLNNDTQGLTIYIGSDSSPVLIRIYDKAAERGFNDEDDRHWIRVELQLRDDRCLAAAAAILEEQHVGRAAVGVLRNYIQFRTPSESDSNKSRWPIAPYWDRLLLDMERISLWISPGEPYNFSKTERHMVLQYGQALLCFHEINGSIEPLLALAKKTHPVLNKKYRTVINTFEQIRDQAAISNSALLSAIDAIPVVQDFLELPADDPDYQLVFDLFGGGCNESDT